MSEADILLFSHQQPRCYSYLILISIGHLRDFFGKKFYPAYYKDLIPHDVSIFASIQLA